MVTKECALAQSWVSPTKKMVRDDASLCDYNTNRDLELPMPKKPKKGQSTRQRKATGKARCSPQPEKRIIVPNYPTLARVDRLWSELKELIGTDVVDPSNRNACRIVDDLLKVREFLEYKEHVEKFQPHRLYVPPAFRSSLPSYSNDDLVTCVAMLAICDTLRDDFEWLRSTRRDICNRLVARYASGIQKAREMIQQENAKRRQRAFRFEISIAHLLTHHGYDFANPDSPDFQLRGEHKGVSIECTSRFLSEAECNSDKAIEEAVRSCVRDKRDKRYANDALALFIDFTHVAYVAGRKQLGSEISTLYREAAGKQLAGCKGQIGAIVFCHYRIGIERIGNIVRCCGLSPLFEDPIIAKHCDPKLRRFLDDYRSKHKRFTEDDLRKSVQQDFAR